MKRPDVSVVIPAYNVEAYLRGCLDSILGQTWAPREIIVVDDGSTDGTAAVAAEFSDRVRLIRKANAGVASARNAGIRAAQGRLIAFLDADDAWFPDCLLQQVRVWMKEGPRCLVHADGYLWDGRPDGHGTRLSVHTPVPHDDVDPVASLAAAAFLCFSTVVVDREALLAAGLFEERLRHFEDADLCFRLALDGVRFRFNPVPLVLRRKHAGSLTSRGYEHTGLWASALERVGCHPNATSKARAHIEQALGNMPRSLRLAAMAALMAGDAPGARRCWTQAWVRRPWDIKTLLGLPLMWAAPGAALGAARRLHRARRYLGWHSPGVERIGGLLETQRK